MKTLMINRSDWESGLKTLRRKYQLFALTIDDTSAGIRKLKPDESPDMTSSQTRFSYKSIVFPQSQSMFSFTANVKDESRNQLREIEVDPLPKIVLAIRPCDAAAFKISEKNFSNSDCPDPYWGSGYKSLILVGLACDTPMSTCFCTSVDGSPYHEKGLDILLSQNGDGYLARILTKKGETLAKIAGWDQESDSSAFVDRKIAAEQKISSKISTRQLKRLNQNDLFNASFWEDVAFACLSCGTCAYSCPTCWCFDIQDETRGDTGVRQRNWDSCMYPIFTLEGSGHNPRSTQTQRVRQRFMHKLKYFLDKYNEGIQCVGCGRCVKLCPVNIDIRNVCEIMNSYQPATR